MDDGGGVISAPYFKCEGKKLDWKLTIPFDGTVFAIKRDAKTGKSRRLSAPLVDVIGKTTSVDLSSSSEEEDEEEEEEEEEVTGGGSDFDTRLICVFCDRSYSCDVRVGCRVCGHVFHRNCWDGFKAFLRIQLCPICTPNYESAYGCPFGCAQAKTSRMQKFKMLDAFQPHAVISNKRKLLTEYMRAHLVDRHRLILCKVCGTKLLRHNRASHRARECGSDDTKCPVDGCGTVIDSGLYARALENPAVLMQSYHRCTGLHQCTLCGGFYLNEEDRRKHASKCQGGGGCVKASRPKRKSAKEAKELIAFGIDFVKDE